MVKLLDPRNDFLFKRIFGSEENKDILLEFLNRTFAEAERPLLSAITLLNPFTTKDAPHEKQAILDIHGMTAEGEHINVEMQLINKYDTEKGLLYYWGKQYTGQLLEGQPYKVLKKCITINILNYKLVHNNRCHNVFHLREDNSGLVFNEDIEIHILELSKLEEWDSVKQQKGGLANWLQFLKDAHQLNREVLAVKDPVLKKALDTLEYLSQDVETRRLYEERQRYLHDEASMLLGAKEEGIALGKAEGKAESKLETAEKMLRKGLDTLLIMEVTGLSEKMLNDLKRNQGR